MSTNIDEKIVEMRFDNKEFEKNVQTSIHSIENLNRSLELSGASKGLESVSSAAKQIDMSGLSSAVETVGVRFSAMQVLAVTALTNIANAAYDAGKNILSALTIEPVTTGFQEYETQINSVQTILANTQATSKQVVKQVSEDVIAASEAVLAATQENNEAALKNLQKAHKEELRDYQKLADDELDTLNDKHEEELDALDKTHKTELKAYEKLADEELAVLDNKHEAALDALEKAHDAELKEYENMADEELEILESKHEDEMDALEGALDEESRLLKEAHQEKLDLYKEEYMEKLKALDEERYNVLKAIDDEIDSINGLTKAEEEALEVAKQEAKIAELQSDIDHAKTYKDRAKAEQELAKYKEELARKQLLKEREAKIAQLKLDKSNIEAEYEAKEKELKAEYEAKKEEENKLYELESANLKKEHAERKKALKDTQEEEKKLLRERLELEKESIKERQNAESKALKDTQAEEKKSLKEQLDLEKESIKERQDAESKALKDTHEDEKDLIQERLSLEKEAIQERQDAEIDAMNAAHKVAISNIRAQQSAAAEIETIAVEPSTLEDVNRALDELNQYADKTIYNFTEMTRNIGTFTAAGIDLDTSVAAIKGIANLGAVSGSTSQQVSTAMYQISQALASGRVSLMDWNSITNAGMGGQVFQDSLKETARVHGIAIDDIIAQNGSFRESLKTGWLSADILTETLSKFTGDLTEEQLKTMGYADEQIAGIIKMGETANDAATKVKTFTQLFDTLKEAAQSGWTQTWEIIVGDFEEAKELLTSASDVFGGLINNFSETRNEMLKVWKDLGGRTALIEAIKNAFEGVASIIKPVSEAFKEIFPPMTGERLYDITKGLEELTSKLILNDTQSENLKSTFKGLFSILDIGKQILSAVWDAVKPLVGGIGELGDGILGVTGKFGDWLVNLSETTKETDVFSNAIQSVVDFITTAFDKATDVVSGLVDGVRSLIDTVKENVSIPGLEIIHEFLERLHERMGQVVSGAETFGDVMANVFGSIGDAFTDFITSTGFDEFLTVFGSLWDGLKTIGQGVLDACKSIGGGMADVTGEINFDQVFDVVNGGLIAGILVGIKKFIGDLGSTFDELGGIIGKVSGILDSVRGCFEAYQQKIQADTLLTIAGAIGLLAASILVVASIDSEKLATSLGAITALFADLIASMSLLDKMSGTKGAAQAASAMVSMSLAVVLLAAALKTVAAIDSDKLTGGIAGVTGLAGVVVAAAKLMSSDTKKVMKGATSLIAFSAAITILASACADLSELSWEELAKGLVGVGVLMAEVSVFLNTAKFGKNAISTATGIVILSSAIKILASACGDFASMSWGDIAKGLVAVGALLTELSLFTNLTGNAKHVISTGTAMVLLGAAMKIFASAVKDFSGMDWEELGRGLLGMAGALTAVTVAVNLMPKNMVGIGTGLIAVSAAIVILAEALKTMGKMSWEQVAKGLTTLGGSMTILAVGLNAMKGTLAGASAMLVASAALAVMTPVLSILGAMSWEAIAKGLIAIAGAFTVIGVAGAVLTPIMPAILGLGGAFALIGVGVAAIGAGLLAAGLGLTALAAGFTALAAIGTVGATAVVAALTIIITGVADLIPAIVEKIAEGIIVFCEALAAGIPAICDAVVTIVSAVVSALVETVPTVVEGIFVLLYSVLTTLVEYTPKIVQAAFDILLGCLKVISDNISMVVQTAIDIVLGFIDGIAKKLPDVIQAGFNLLLSFINGITNAINTNTPLLVDAMKELALALVDAAILVITGGVDLFKEAGQKIMDTGLIKGIKDKVSSLCATVGNAISKAIQKVKDKFKDWLDVGKKLVSKMVDGIKGATTTVADVVGKFMSDGMKKVTDKLSDWTTAGGDLIKGFIKGIKDAAGGVIEAAKGVVSDALEGAKRLLGIKSPSREFAKVGRWSDEGLVVGLKTYSGRVTDAAKDVGRGALTAMSDAISGISDIVNDEMDAEPTIRPVLDLSNIESGTRSIDAMLSRAHAVDVNTRMNDRYGTIDSETMSNSASGNTYQFTQNNYSPKALSNIEIYRQTKNQFSAMKRMVER